MILPRLVTAVITTSLLSSCAAGRMPSPMNCALIGAGAGTVGGAIGGTYYADDHDDGAAAAIGIGSVLGGALIGYTVCALLEEDEAPPPPKVAAPPPAPSKPDPCVEIVRLEGVTFDLNRATLRPDAISILDEVVVTLKTCPTKRVLIGAHTDSSGSDEYNLELSRRRAQSVRDYLESRGINSARLKSEGYGESRPVASNDTPEGRARNRRVELQPLK
jgi:outer membrane protein OmpA-like peptidoglycan-associated protein